jgi:hypothetical protein
MSIKKNNNKGIIFIHLLVIIIISDQLAMWCLLLYF